MDLGKTCDGFSLAFPEFFRSMIALWSHSHLDSANAQTIWSKLTTKEQEDFMRQVKSGQLEFEIVMEPPWWEDGEPVGLTSDGSTHPWPDLPSILELTPKPPPQDLIYNVLEVL
jgi:hypothetical protein